MVEFFNFFFYHLHLPLYPSLQGSGEEVRWREASGPLFYIELCWGTHDWEPVLLSYWLHTFAMEAESTHLLLRVAFKISYNFFCKTPGCWINVVSLTETILNDGLCPRECHRLGEPSFCGGTPCTEHSLIHKDKYFTCGLTKWDKVSNSGKN